MSNKEQTNNFVVFTHDIGDTDVDSLSSAHTAELPHIRAHFVGSSHPPFFIKLVGISYL